MHCLHLDRWSARRLARPWQSLRSVALALGTGLKGLTALPALIALLALLALPRAAQAQNDWAACADEGGVCRFNGEALVRFGIDGQYAFRVATQRVICDTVEFGDPAPNRRKQCQVSAGWRQDSRYRNWRGGAGPADADDGWRVCASEGELCRLPGQTQVRYGANGRYEVRNATGNVMCSNGVFGDPAPDMAKQCEYAVGAVGTSGLPGMGLPTQVRRSTDSGLDWQRCASEGGDCRFNGPVMLRYGRDGRWAYQEARGGLPCSSAAFGIDPVPNQPKQCELLRQRR